VGTGMANLRNDGRMVDELRQIKINRNYTKYAAGSVLVEFGETKVICTATIEDKVPDFLKGQGCGWVTAEYAMLPSSTHTRNKREAVLGKVSSRSQEISRLIGRSLRSAVDMKKMGERQILIDCNVIQADGGTRTASITGAFVAMYDAVTKLLALGKITELPIKQFLAAISVGVCNNVPMLDLNYTEDSNCDADMNVVMFEDLGVIEIQGTAEKNKISRNELNRLLDLAEIGIKDLIKKQKAVLNI
jgi:ribonuclease PH